MMRRGLRLLIDAAAITALRRYIVKRIDLQPPKKWNKDEMLKFEQKINQFIDVIERMDTRLWSYLTDKEKEKVRDLAQRYPQYIAYINAENVLSWLAIDVPIAYGIIKAHPKGEEWLRQTLNRFLQEAMNYQVEVIEEREEEAHVARSES